MKFDKETIIALCLCVVFLLAWNPICKYMGWIPENPPPKSQEQVTPQKQVAAAEKSKSTSAVAISTAKDKKVENIASTKSVAKISVLPPQKIENKDSNLTFDPNSGTLKTVSFPKYFKQDRKTLLQFNYNPSPGALAISGANEWQVEAVIDNSIDKDNKSYKLVRRIKNADGKKFILTQNWQLVDSYILKYSFTIKNISNSELDFPSLTVTGVTLPPFSVFSGDDHVNQDSNTIDYCTVDNKLNSIKTDDDEEDFFASARNKIRWCGDSNKYFATLILTETPFDKLSPKREMFTQKTKPKEYFIAGLGGTYNNVKVPADSEKTFSLKCYNGPKIISELVKFDQQAPEIMNLSYGGPLDWIAEKLLSFLIFLKKMCGSYGWSIIIITVLVRLLFWPITQKANNSMKRMQKVQPQMKEIREKYKNDPQTMNAKVMELYRTEKVNPLGGCLPILLQIPVFIALYSTLNGAVELRQVPFWWIADLAKPDTVAVIFGLPLNPLVIVMTSLMVLQQRLTPSAMDPNQQKMMMFMPIMMLFILYNLPAGLTLYWTVSQILAILQLFLQKRMNSGDENSITKAKKAV